MIKIWTGTPGSGKSLHAANTCWHRLRNKRNIIANFPIDIERIAESTAEYICKKIGIGYIKKKLVNLGNLPMCRCI